MIDVEWLGKILERPALKRRHRTVEVRVGSHDDHRHLWEALSDVAQERQAGFTGHADIGNQYLWLTLLQRL